MSFPVTASAALGSSGLAGGKEGTFVSLSFFFFKYPVFSLLLFNTAAAGDRTETAQAGVSGKFPKPQNTCRKKDFSCNRTGSSRCC